MSNDLFACYSHRPIVKLSSLEKIFGKTINELEKIISNIESYYKENKPNMKGRVTNRVLNPLKIIQWEINENFLKKVYFPKYTHGFIEKRSIMTNASQHLQKKILINVDIKKFYDNCKTDIIFNIWKYFFKFSDEGSRILTGLTTLNGKLPQGTCTSPRLSNLIFWKDEPKLVSKFISLGLSYTRYGDDISISSCERKTNKEQENIISDVYGMLKSNGFSPNRKKHCISNPSREMLVNGQSVNGNNVSITRKYLMLLRSEIFLLEKNTTIMANSDLQLQVRRLAGKINHAKQYKSNKVIIGLENRLKAVEEKISL